MTGVFVTVQCLLITSFLAITVLSEARLPPYNPPLYSPSAQGICPHYCCSCPPNFYMGFQGCAEDDGLCLPMPDDDIHFNPRVLNDPSFVLVITAPLSLPPPPSWLSAMHNMIFVPCLPPLALHQCENVPIATRLLLTQT